MFPLMFWHYPGNANDGLLEPRVLISRDGSNFSYIGPNGRDAFVPRGVGKHRPNHTGIFEGEFDAASTAVARGIFEVDDKLVLLGYGSQYTHGGYVGFQRPGGAVLTGLQRLELRKDGFGSLSTVDSTTAVSARTVAVKLPPKCTAGKQLQLMVNVFTPVGGHFTAALLNAEDSLPVPDYDCNSSVKLIGNFIGEPMSWGAATTPPTPSLPQTSCSYEMPDEKTCTGKYIAMSCTEASKLSKSGCEAHGCDGKPTKCDHKTGFCHGNGTGTALCVLAKPASPPAPPPPTRIDLNAFAGKAMKLTFEGKNFDLYSFGFSCVA